MNNPTPIRDIYDYIRYKELMRDLERLIQQIDRL